MFVAEPIIRNKEQFKEQEAKSILPSYSARHAHS